MRKAVNSLRARLTVLVLLACGFAALAPVSNGP
ncbi:outer membrane lipopolysaccharide assembly protein LptE/RlpB [Streptomyces phaeochromogenes]|jgi:hypothetical protein|nr:outer membrane lipopolysaccharide assembly protein LptE/RlpB [Streptomyces phaeochromogenes]